MDKPTPTEAERVADRADAVEAQAKATQAEYATAWPQGGAGNTTPPQLTVGGIRAELVRRIELYRTAPRGDNLARADALQALLHWIEATR
jgi:hypothetical protein